MEKGLGNDSSSSISSSSSSTASTRDMFLNNVSRNSHKIFKPIRKPLLPPTGAAEASASAVLIRDPSSLNSAPSQPQSQQPPVYNINKNDFRDVVQKLTGSPAHERIPTPPPPAVTHPRAPSSRLQRIRPPPLAQIGNRPLQFTHLVPRAQSDAGQLFAAPLPPQAQPFQPLPPLPSVHPAAESPVSAYMRFLQSSTSGPAPSSMWNAVAPVGPRHDSQVPQNEFSHRPPFPPIPQPESPISAYMRLFQNSAFSSAASPRGNSVASPPRQPQPPPPYPPISAPQQQQPPQQEQQPPQQQQQQQPPLPSSPFPVLPLSPLPFGCAPSPKSPYGMLSPGFLFSPTGQLGLPPLPLSPTLPVPSPRWNSL